MEKECCNINQIFQGFYTKLIGFVQKRVQDQTAVEDIVQEVFLKLVESHKKSTEINNIKGWIYQVTRNVLNDYYRNQQKEYKVLDDFKIDTEMSSQSFDEVETDGLIPMINALPKKYSTPLYLSDIEQMPQKEIAAQLGLGLSATKMRIQRGREKLRDLFIQCCNIEFDTLGNYITCSKKPGCDLK